MIEELDQVSIEDRLEDEFPPPAKSREIVCAVLTFVLTVALSVVFTVSALEMITQLSLSGTIATGIVISCWNLYFWGPTTVIVGSWWTSAMRSAHPDRTFLFTLYMRFQGKILLAAPVGIIMSTVVALILISMTSV